MKKKFISLLGLLAISQIASADYAFYGAKDIYVTEEGKVITMRSHVRKVEAEQAEKIRLAKLALAESERAEGARFALLALPKANAKNLKQLATFNNVVNIRPINFNVVKDVNGEPSVAYNFIIKNTSNRNIKEVKWFSAVYINNNIIDLFTVPAVFGSGLAPEESKTTTFLVPLKNYSPEVQKALSNPGSTVANIVNYAGELTFTNKQKIVVTTNKMMQNALKEQQQASRPATQKSNLVSQNPVQTVPTTKK